MTNLIHRSILFMLLLFLFGNSFAQNKFEKEVRISEGEVPITAKAFVDSISFDGKVKWYQEISSDGKSFEAKARSQNHLFSIEFDTLGQLQDIERRIVFKRLAPAKQQLIETVLDRQFERYKIVKVQEQYIAAPSLTEQLFPASEAAKELTPNYEIVVRGKRGAKKQYFELLLDPEGVLLRLEEIVDRPLDNIEF